VILAALHHFLQPIPSKWHASIVSDPIGPLIQKKHVIDAVQAREYIAQAAAMVGMQIIIQTPAKLSLYFSHRTTLTHLQSHLTQLLHHSMTCNGLINAMTEICESILLEEVNKHVNQMPRVVQAMINAEGEHTRF
jgi:hypothetical protein